jgi:hypothetical protein
MVEMRMSYRTLSFLIFCLFISAFFEGSIVELKANEIKLPKTIGHWTRPDSPRAIDAGTIFDYMDGAGELYLGYRFHRLDVLEYTSDSEDNILVELYFMETSDDAYGLLSLDWGGEPVSLDGSQSDSPDGPPALSPRALYGEGLLRIWSDDLYARVMAFRETDAAKQAVLALGRAIAADRTNPPEPEISRALPVHVDSTWDLRRDRLSFFRSYLVLNSIYYLSEENILDLDHSAEAVTAPYQQTSGTGDHKRLQSLLVKYESPERARGALSHFRDIYLPEHKIEPATDLTGKNPSVFELEDGWLAYGLFGQYIAIVFECPNVESARVIIQKTEHTLLARIIHEG